MQIKTDFLIIGSGISGLISALELSKEGQVILVSKDKIKESNTYYAQGGVASVEDRINDSFNKHIEDTLKAGDGLCNTEVVGEVIKCAPKIIDLLTDYAVDFEKENNKYKLSREGGHSENRVLYYKDITGKEIERKLYKKVKNNPNIIIHSNHFAADLIMEYKLSTINSDKKKCWGAFIYDKKGNQVVSVGAKYTILATGGAGKVYLYTSNPDIATGDSIAMACRAGAEIQNMEFMQFNPTTLYHPYAKNFLISEAVRGEGGVLKTIEGKKFMKNYHPMKSLAPRDIVARSMDEEMKKSGADHLYLDISMKSESFIKNRFPNIYKKCLKYNIDITKDMIPVVPAAHYNCGGIKAELNGKTNIDNLFAIGETACTGFHGANRLASNSLLEGAVMAMKMAKTIRSRTIKDISIPKLDNWQSPVTLKHENVIINNDWDELRRTMWNFVGIVRSNKRLDYALKRIALIEKEISDFYYNNPVSTNLLEMRNLIINAKIIINAAKWRKESRGIHYTLDYPDKKNNFKNKFSNLTKDDLK